MEQIDNANLYEAALLLKADCEKNYSDGKCHCPFSTPADETGCYGCMLGYPPKDYEIKKPSNILCNESRYSLWDIKNAFGDVKFYSYLPNNAFYDLSVGEIAIDDIIKEDEDGRKS